MENKNKYKNSKNKKKKKPSAIIPLLSLGITVFIIYLLVNDIEAMIAGDYSSRRILLTAIESVGLFVIPLIFNPNAVKRRFNKREQARIQKEKDRLDLIIKKTVKLEETFTPAVIRKCPRCGFISTGNAKVCFNCGYKLNW
ncbi:MAG: hypothetical protein ACTSWX_13000 [Promethearchaeota archaeon]